MASSRLVSVGLHVDSMSGSDGLFFGGGVGEEQGGEMDFRKKVLSRSSVPATGFRALHIKSASLYLRADCLWMGIPNVPSFTNLFAYRILRFEILYIC